MFEIFTTDKYDNNIGISDGVKNYTYKQLKQLVASEIEHIKGKSENVVILSGDNFAFVIQFLASLFCGKKIYIITDRARLADLDFKYYLLEDYKHEFIENYDYPEIDIKKPLFHFYTSGSSGKPKSICESFYNLLKEAQDMADLFDFNGKKYSVVSTTTMCHRFGLTFHMLMPLCAGLVINTKDISYPDNLDSENTILVSTPTFLSSVPKFDTLFKVPPEYIFTAGAKLDEQVYEYLEKNSKVVEMYGCTEIGVAAYKTHFADDLKLFDNVELVSGEENVEVKTEYAYEKSVIINDKIEENGRYIKIKNRTDRLFKIYEKRVSADELECKLKISEFVNDCYITKCGEKLVCLCALSKSGQEYLLQNNLPKLTKKLKQHLKKYSDIVPQKWKYTDEIPRTIAGKVNKGFINHIFSVKISLPVILDRVISENGITYKIFFYNQCNFFKGHFSEFKIVPGVFQLFLAKELATLYFGLSLGYGQLKKIKFSNVIRPDSIIYLKLGKNNKNVSYEIFSEDKKYASGTFLCENIFDGVI